jgi:hypothetical protein
MQKMCENVPCLFTSKPHDLRKRGLILYDLKDYIHGEHFSYCLFVFIECGNKSNYRPIVNE